MRSILHRGCFLGALSFTVIAMSSQLSFGLTGMALYTTCPGSLQYRTGQLVVKYMSSGTTNTLISEETVFGPCFSPDGQHIAYATAENQVPNAINIIDINGNNLQQVCECGGGNAKEVYCNWTDDGYIYWTQCDQDIYRVKTNGTEKEVVWTSSDEKHALSVACDNHLKMAITFPTDPGFIHWNSAVYTEGGDSWLDFGEGCTGSLRPDGAKLAQNMGHEQIEIKNADASGVDNPDFSISRPSGDGFWVLKWAKHDADHLMSSIEVSTDDGMRASDVYVYEFSTGDFTQVSADPAVGWDFFPQEITDPVSTKTSPVQHNAVGLKLSQSGGIITANISSPAVTRLTLLSANGERILSKQVQNTGSLMLNTHPLVPGVYLLKTAMSDGKSTMRSIQVMR